MFHSLHRARQFYLCFPLAYRNFRIDFESDKHILFNYYVYELLTNTLSISPTSFSFSPLFVVDLCTMDNGGCSHNCTIAPGEGILCSCPAGMELGTDNKTCQIQSFCAKHLKCSQRCVQEKATVKCACYEGWALGPDSESCKSTGEGETGWRR